MTRKRKGNVAAALAAWAIGLGILVVACSSGDSGDSTPAPDPCPGIDLSSDSQNCGLCGYACPGGAACVSGVCACPPSAGGVSFSTDIQPIFDSSCATRGCHTGARPQAELDLSSGAAYANLVNAATAECAGSRQRVIPGDLPGSYLYSKLTGYGMCTGSQMPKAGSSLPTGQIDTIAAWICSNAPDN